MATKAEIQAAFDKFRSDWIGKRVDTDGFPAGEIYQCVDLAKRYARDVTGVPFGSYGNAIKWWTATHPNLLAKYNKIATTTVEKGDIVPLRTNGRTDFSGDGHIGIATGAQTATTVEILEQNGSTGGGQGTGGDAIRARFVQKSRVPGILRPKTTEPPKPAPNMPAIGSRIQLIPRDVRTTYRAGTATVAGKINVTDDSFIYTVRGYDAKYPGRIIINSASAGGNGVGLALYYVNGNIIPGWKKV